MSYEAVPGNGPFYVDSRTLHAYVMPAHHFHKEYEIYYQEEGERVYFIGDSSYHVKPGDLVLVDAQTLHRTRNLTEESRRTLIHFVPGFIDGDSYPELLGAFGECPVLRLKLKQREPIERLLAVMLKEFGSEEYGSDLYCKLALSELLLVAGRLSREHQEDDLLAADPAARRISEAVRFINASFRAPLELTELAEQFHWSPSHFSRMFRQTTGFTFVEYVGHLRVREAQRLLTSTKLRMLAVAEEVGYESLTHFGRVFKGITGMTPTEYRRRWTHEEGY